MEKKKVDLEFVILIIGVVFVILGFIVPNSGKYVLLDQLLRVLFLWALFSYLILKVIKKKVKSIFIRIVIVAFALFNLFLTSQIILDLHDGTSYIKLSNIQLTKRMRAKTLNIAYYVRGTDEKGKRYSLLLSKSDVDLLRSAHEVYIEYYPHTERVLRVSTSEISNSYMVLEYTRSSKDEMADEYSNYYFIQLFSNKNLIFGHVHDSQYSTVLLSDSDYNTIVKLLSSKEASKPNYSGTTSNTLEYITRYDQFGKELSGIGMNHGLFDDIKTILIKYVS